MAKRFIKSDIFQDPFIRSLEGPYKALWVYLFCNCNSSGLWPVEIEIASIRIDQKITHRKALDYFMEKILILDNGSTWFLPSFIAIQYGNELKLTNPATRNVINDLLKYGLLEEKNEGVFTLKQRGFEGACIAPMDMDKEKDKDMDKEKERKKEPLIFPFESENFKNQWSVWKQYRQDQHKFKYKSKSTEQGALKVLSRMAETEQEAIEIIHQSIASGWKGFFQLKHRNTNDEFNKARQLPSIHD